MSSEFNPNGQERISPERAAFESALSVINNIRAKTDRLGRGKDFADFILDEVGNRLDLYEFKKTKPPLIEFFHPDKRLSERNFIEVISPNFIHMVKLNPNLDIGLNIYITDPEPTIFLELFGTGTTREIWIMTPGKDVPKDALERFRQELVA